MGTKDRSAMDVVRDLATTSLEHSQRFAFGSAAVLMNFTTRVCNTTAPRLNHGDPPAVVLVEAMGIDLPVRPYFDS